MFAEARVSRLECTHTQTHTERQTQCALGVLCMRREAVYDGTFHAAKAAVN